MNYESFAALIYVTDTENEAVMRMYDWKILHMDGDDQTYYQAQSSDGRVIYAARQDEMGMTASATFTMKLVEHFRPKAIIAKSVCDFADSRKSDKYQKFAAFTSCQFVKLMIDKILD